MLLQILFHFICKRGHDFYESDFFVPKNNDEIKIHIHRIVDNQDIQNLSYVMNRIKI